MSTKRQAKIPASDRSMDPEQQTRSQVFFFPKHNPPVSVRAATREEAEQLLEANNTQENV